MALNFPDNPFDGQEWLDPSNNVLYVYVASTNSWFVKAIGDGGPRQGP